MLSTIILLKQGFTFGKAGEILTMRLRFIAFKAMLRQVKTNILICSILIIVSCTSLEYLYSILSCYDLSTKKIFFLVLKSILLVTWGSVKYL